MPIPFRSKEKIKNKKFQLVLYRPFPTRCTARNCTTSCTLTISTRLLRRSRDTVVKGCEVERICIPTEKRKTKTQPQNDNQELQLIPGTRLGTWKCELGRSEPDSHVIWRALATSNRQDIADIKINDREENNYRLMAVTLV